MSLPRSDPMISRIQIRDALPPETASTARYETEAFRVNRAWGFPDWRGEGRGEGSSRLARHHLNMCLPRSHSFITRWVTTNKIPAGAVMMFVLLKQPVPGTGCLLRALTFVLFFTTCGHDLRCYCWSFKAILLLELASQFLH